MSPSPFAERHSIATRETTRACALVGGGAAA
jgi:hypothetical protein